MSPPQKSTTRIQPGFVINERFEITRKIGEGGFALVFEGQDVSLDRQVAIKILHGALTENTASREQTVLRFKREAQLAATVEHDAIVKIYDVGEIDEIDEPFIVMEYLRGKSLQEYIDEEGALEATKLLPLFQNLLIGLGFAHEAGIVHKDLKPDNIFYRYPNSIRESFCVVDFGIAHIGRSNSQRFTGNGQFFGTPSYMAPEYITDQTVSPKVDVYQMGLVLIECLTGRPFLSHENDIANLLMHLHRKVPLPKPLADSPLGPILERAIALDPLERYADAMEFAEALAGVPPDEVPKKAALHAVYTMESKEGEVLPTEQWEIPGFDGDLNEYFERTQRSQSHEDTQLYTNPTDAAMHKATTAYIPTGVIQNINGKSEPIEEPGTRRQGAQATAGVVLKASNNTPIRPVQPEHELTTKVMRAHTDHAQTTKERVILATLLVTILLAIGAVVMLIANQEPKVVVVNNDVAKTSPPSKENTDAQLAALTTPSMAAKTSLKKTPPAPKIEEPETMTPILIKVITRPLGAEVLVGRKLLGETPLIVKVSNAEESRQLTLRKKGYKNEKITVSSQDHPDVTYVLAKLKRAPKKNTPRDKTKPKPKDPASTILLPSKPQPSKIALPK